MNKLPYNVRPFNDKNGQYPGGVLTRNGGEQKQKFQQEKRDNQGMNYLGMLKDFAKEISGVAFSLISMMEVKPQKDYRELWISTFEDTHWNQVMRVPMTIPPKDREQPSEAMEIVHIRGNRT